MRKFLALLRRLFSFLFPARTGPRARARSLEPLTPLTTKPAEYQRTRWEFMRWRSFLGPQCRCSYYNAFCKRHRVYTFKGIPDREITLRRGKHGNTTHVSKSDLLKRDHSQRSVEKIGKELLPEMPKVHAAVASA